VYPQKTLEKSTGIFVILSIRKPWSTFPFRRCVEKSGDSLEIHRDFCDSPYAQTAANVPSLIDPGYIRIISWIHLDKSWYIWKESKER
jgi:hypothetical protein